MDTGPRLVLIFLLSFLCFALQYDLSAILSFVHLSVVQIRLLPFVFLGFGLSSIIVLRLRGTHIDFIYFLPWIGIIVFSSLFVFFNQEYQLVLMIPLLFAAVYAPLVHLLTEGRFRTNYFYDLIGGAAGFAFAFHFLGRIGAEWTYAWLLIGSSIIPLVAAPSRFLARRLALLALCVSIALVAWQAVYHKLDLLYLLRNAPLIFHDPLYDAYAIKGLPGVTQIATKWSSISRVDIFAASSSKNAALFYNRKRFSPLSPFTSDIAYDLLKVINPAIKSALVIGVGGGRDIAFLERRGVSDITGIEVNDATYDLLSGEFAHLASDAYVKHDIRLAEGRAFLEHASDSQYDVITLPKAELYTPHLITPILIEAHLYTEEALRLYWQRLSDDGVIVISRDIVYFQTKKTPQLHTMLETLKSAFRKEGVDLRLHAFAFTDEELGVGVSSDPEKKVKRTVNYFISRRPFDPQMIEKIRSMLDVEEIHLISPMIADPRQISALWPSEKCFLEAFDNDRVQCLETKVAVVTDDRPFFHDTRSGRFVLDILIRYANVVLLAALMGLLLVLGISREARSLIYRAGSVLPIVFGLGTFYGFLVPYYYHVVLLQFRSPLDMPLPLAQAGAA